MKRRKKPLQTNLLRRSNQTISIILGFVLLLGALAACVLSRTAPGNQDKKAMNSPIGTAQ